MKALVLFHEDVCRMHIFLSLHLNANTFILNGTYMTDGVYLS